MLYNDSTNATLQEMIKTLAKVAKAEAASPNRDVSLLALSLAQARDSLNSLPAETDDAAWTVMRDRAHEGNVQSTNNTNAALMRIRESILSRVALINRLLETVEPNSGVAVVLRAAAVMCEEDLGSTMPYVVPVAPMPVDVFRQNTIDRAKADVASFEYMLSIVGLGTMPSHRRLESFEQALALIDNVNQ